MSGILSSQAQDHLCQQYLDLLYQGMDGHGPANQHAKPVLAETYGEILYPSINKLIAASSFTEHDVFVDYGSGLGKIVTQVYLKTPVKQAIGIELLPELHAFAEQTKIKMMRELPGFFPPQRTLSFVQGDFLQQFFPATIALICSPCFTQEVLNAIGRILDNTQSLHTIFTLRPIETLKRLPFKRTLRIEGSWDSTLCYLYQH